MWVVLLVLLTVLLGIIIVYSSLYGISPTPTSGAVKRALFDVLPPIGSGIIVELGSGWGFLALALARHYPQSRVIAYEISPVPYYFSKLIAYFSSLSNLTIERKNFFHISLIDVSLAVCYLYPEAMRRLNSKFESELSSEAFVASHTFAIPGWRTARMERAPDLYNTPVYLYRADLNKHVSRKNIN